MPNPHHGNWIRVSRSKPCPICGKPDNCEVSSDGGAVWCGRVSQGSIRENGGGQFLHRLDTAKPFPFLPPLPTQEAPKKRYRDWAGLANSLQRDADLPRQQLAQSLGVSAESLVELRVGWNRWDRYWSFPEMDGGGHVIGINARYESGQKKRLFGSRSGLAYADSWNVGEGPILLPEGASDTAALMTIGLNAVGRPSNAGGVDLLIDLLFEIPIQRRIVVIGERDEKPDGKWPGRDGAISTATKLAEALERPIDWVFPPDNAKDSRAWLKSMPSLPVERLADLFITGIDTKQINPPIRLRIDPEPANTLTLGQWREMMLHARLQSLGKPGAYLDCSPTGSGKSHVDFAAVQVLLQREGAA